jgi:hypothetical protein
MNTATKNKLEWTDVTSYSRDQQPRFPTCWEISDGVLRVTVVWNHLDLPGMWCFHCRALDFDTHALPNVTSVADHKRAKAEAIAVLRKRLVELRRSVASFVGRY